MKSKKSVMDEAEEDLMQLVNYQTIDVKDRGTLWCAQDDKTKIWYFGGHPIVSVAMGKWQTSSRLFLKSKVVKYSRDPNLHFAISPKNQQPAIVLTLDQCVFLLTKLRSDCPGMQDLKAIFLQWRQKDSETRNRVRDQQDEDFEAFLMNKISSIPSPPPTPETTNSVTRPRRAIKTRSSGKSKTNNDSSQEEEELYHKPSKKQISDSEDISCEENDRIDVPTPSSTKLTSTDLREISLFIQKWYHHFYEETSIRRNQQEASSLIAKYIDMLLNVDILSNISNTYFKVHKHNCKYAVCDLGPVANEVEEEIPCDDCSTYPVKVTISQISSDLQLQTKVDFLKMETARSLISANPYLKYIDSAQMLVQLIK